MKTILLSEAFRWAEQLWPALKQFQKQFETDGVCFYEVALHADIKNRIGRVYTSKQATIAAASLSERPLNINHIVSLPFPDNEVVVARFEDSCVECIIRVADKDINGKIATGNGNVSWQEFAFDSYGKLRVRHSCLTNFNVIHSHQKGLML